MGPQPLSRGNYHPSIPSYVGNDTSMGPQPLSRGNLSAAVFSMGQRTLQWGRNLSVAETDWVSGEFRFTWALQWGRNLSVAETRRERERGCQGTETSMGPQPLSRGNKGEYIDHAGTAETSMGPQPLSRGNSNSAVACSLAFSNFNGAATSQSRKLCSPRFASDLC